MELNITERELYDSLKKSIQASEDKLKTFEYTNSIRTILIKNTNAKKKGEIKKKMTMHREADDALIKSLRDDIERCKDEMEKLKVGVKEVPEKVR